MKRLFVLMLAGLFLFSSCATIIKGTNQTVSIQSEPAGAECDVKDSKTGIKVAHITTPGAVNLKRGSGYFQSPDYRITCNLLNYNTGETPLISEVNGWYLGGNLLFGGLIGYFIVDPLSGAMWSYPDQSFISLSEVK